MVRLGQYLELVQKLALICSKSVALYIKGEKREIGPVQGLVLAQACTDGLRRETRFNAQK